MELATEEQIEHALEYAQGTILEYSILIDLMFSFKYIVVDDEDEVIIKSLDTVGAAYSAIHLLETGIDITGEYT